MGLKAYLPTKIQNKKNINTVQINNPGSGFNTSKSTKNTIEVKFRPPNHSNLDANQLAIFNIKLAHENRQENRD